MLWAGFENSQDILNNISCDLDDALHGLGFKKESNKFSAHATLARIRSDRNKEPLLQKLRELNQELNKINFLADNITLFRSKLTSKGPFYQIIYQQKLK